MCYINKREERKGKEEHESEQRKEPGLPALFKQLLERTKRGWSCINPAW